MNELNCESESQFFKMRTTISGGIDRREFVAMVALSKAATVDDVVEAIREIEEEQQLSGKMRALGRLKPIVKGLQEYAGVVEVFVQVKPDVLGLIWGPLKLILKAVSDVTTLFDKMMEVFVDIGRILPQFKKYEEMLTEGQVRPILTLFYKEILAMYSVLLEFLKHPGMAVNLEPFRIVATSRDCGWRRRFSSVVGRMEWPRAAACGFLGYRERGEGHHVLFLFFSHNDRAPTRTQTLHSLLFQFLKQDATLRAEVFRSYSSNEQKFSSDSEWVRSLLSQVLRDAETFVVVDGLDELDGKLRGLFARDILAVLESCPQLRLLVSSRDETDLRKEFTCKRALQVCIQEHNSSDVKQYVQTECDRLVDSLKESGASQETCEQIRAASATVLQKTAGMIMYAHLVFRVAKDLGNEADIRKEFLNLPKNLNEAYGRILRRIQNSDISSHLRAVAVKILSWVACAERPLREEELLQILVIVPGAVDFTKGRKDYRKILHACGPILEIADGLVRFVHFSGKEYLLDKQSNHFLDLTAAHIDAATICATYLSFSTLDPAFEKATADADAMKCEIHQGSFVFLDYAILSWIHHVKMISEDSKTADATGLADLIASLKTLLQKRGQSQFRRTASAKVLLPVFRIFEDYADLQSSLCSAAYFWGRAEHCLLGDDHRHEATTNADPTNLIVGLKSFRASLETMTCPGSKHTSLCRCKDLFQLYGNALYHCDMCHCLAFGKGYDAAWERDSHIQAHTRISRCPDIRYTDDNPSPDGYAMQSESDTELLEVSKIDRYQVLKDGVCSGSLDLICNLWPEEQLHYGILTTLSQLATVNDSLHMVEFIISKCAPDKQEQLKADALAVAIETENLACIKALLSIGAQMEIEAYIRHEAYGHIPCKRLRGNLIKDGKREQVIDSPSGFCRAFGLLRPGLMSFLVDECGITIPPGLRDLSQLFAYVGFRNANPDEVSRRLEAMKTYIHEDWEAKGVYGYGLQALLRQAGVHENAFIFCLENGADPNQLHIATHRRSGQRLVEALRLLLRYGADPNHPSIDRKYDRRWINLELQLRSGYDMSWEEFVKTAKAGESLERAPKA
ncbi:hypothetical protein DL95DRAFT_526798 [Leptodontidium sp. 2 PMI_412]|nr:hypothetical protein DL95DRAFT_526798 [Leptodontidium sp. 2 PMI_412]